MPAYFYFVNYTSTVLVYSYTINDSLALAILIGSTTTVECRFFSRRCYQRIFFLHFFPFSVLFTITCSFPSQTIHKCTKLYTIPNTLSTVIIFRLCTLYMCTYLLFSQYIRFNMYYLLYTLHTYKCVCVAQHAFRINFSPHNQIYKHKNKRDNCLMLFGMAQNTHVRCIGAMQSFLKRLPVFVTK